MNSGIAILTIVRPFCIKYLKLQVIVSLLCLQDEMSPILLASIRGSVDVIPILVQNGANENSKDSVS